MNISIIIPVKEEKDTILPLAEQILSVFNTSLTDRATLNEIIFVDDGSTDTTWQVIEQAASQHAQVIGVKLRRNFGKAAALQQGVLLSTGDIIITMDGDLQDDPTEIPRFLDIMSDGYDLVSGWKKVRHDPLGKTLPSKLFNWVTARISGVHIHDFNCGFKAYRREIFDHVRLYGELHRFVPAIAHSLGYRVTEMAVTHHPRRFGRSKYGLKRLVKGFLDLLTVITITKYGYRPGHLFGGAGMLIFFIGGLMLLYLTLLWLAGYPIGGRPLLVIATLFMIIGVQFVLFGMIGELLVSHNREGQVDRSIVSKIARAP